MASAAVISSSPPLTAESSRSAQRAMDQDDEDDLLAIRLTAAGDTTELERDYADDLEDLVALPLAQHLGPKCSRLPKLHLQPPASSSPATGPPKSPALYASPRIPLRNSASVSATQQGWETLQVGTTPSVSSEPLSVETAAADAAVLLPRPSRALAGTQRRIESERSTRIRENRKTATAEQRSVSQPPAARVRAVAARDDLNQIPPATATTTSSSRPRLTTATNFPSRLSTPRRRVPSQGPNRSFSPRTGTGTGEDPIKHSGTTTELELEKIASSQTTTTRQTLASSSGRAGALKEEEPAAAGAARRHPARPTTARVSSSQRTVSTSRMRTKSAPWPTSSGGDESNEPLPPWFDDSGPRIYRSSEGKLTFAGADPGPPPPPPSSAATSSATGSLPLQHHHRPQDRVLPAVAKRIQAERLKQLQADDQGLGDAWLVSEWGVTGDPRRAVSVPMKALKADSAERSQQGNSSSPTRLTSNAAATVLPHRSSRVADSMSRPAEAVLTQPDPPECSGGDFVAAPAAECTTSRSSFPPRHPPSEEPDSGPHAALAEHGKPRYDDAQQVVRAARAAGDHQTDRLQTGIGRQSSPTSAAAIERGDTRHNVINTSQDDEGRIPDPKSPGCCASCVIC